MSLPITIASAKLVIKVSTKNVFGWTADRYIEGKKEELMEAVRILEAKYEQFVKEK